MAESCLSKLYNAAMLAILNSKAVFYMLICKNNKRKIICNGADALAKDNTGHNNRSAQQWEEHTGSTRHQQSLIRNSFDFWGGARASANYINYY